MVPIRAASAEPDRPATRMPVISGENSRTTEKAMPMVTRDSAPKILSVWMPWIASMTPMAAASNPTMGMAWMPISIICAKIEPSRTGCLRRGPKISQKKLSTTSTPPLPISSRPATE